MSKQALVTGGFGFIGSHLVDALVARGWAVRVLDNLDRRVHPQGRPVYASPDAEYVVADVRDKAAWERALPGIDVVFHQAAYQDYMPDFSTFMSTNATSTALVYEVIRERQLPVEKVVVASSQAAYGEGQYRCAEHGLIQPPTRSEAQLLRGEWEMVCPVCARPMVPERLREEFAHPFNPYAISKYFEELIAIRLGRLLGIPSTALRYSITQGPRQSMFNQYSGICRIFTLRYLRGEAPVIFEDGQQTRDFVHVRDVVAANLLVAADDRADYQAFNVGSGRATTVSEYAEVLRRVLGSDRAPVCTREFRFGDNRHSVSDVAKLESLGWRATGSLEDIFTDYAAWVRSLGDLAAFSLEADRAMRSAGIVRSAAGPSS